MLFRKMQHDIEEKAIVFTQALVRLAEAWLGLLAWELMLSLRAADFEPATAECGNAQAGTRKA